MSVTSGLQHLNLNDKDQTTEAKIFQHIKTGRNCTKHSFGGAYITWGTAPLPSRPSGTQQSLSFPLEVPNLDSSEHTLSLVESIFCLLAPHNGKYRGKAWIVRVEEVDPTTWRLLNPVSRIDNLLDSTLPIMAHIDNPSDFLIDEVARSYALVDNNHLGEAEIRAFKVISLLEPSQGEVNKEDLKLLALDWDGKLAFWKHGDEHWTKILAQYSEDGFRFTDIVSYKGKVYATLTSKHTTKVYEIDPTNLSVDIECAASFGPSSDKIRTCKVAEFNGQLHILNECKSGSIGFHVLNDCGQWEKHKEITCSCSNGYTLFVLDEVSFRIPTHLLGRGFDEDWICVSTNDLIMNVLIMNVSSRGFVGSLGGFAASVEGHIWPNHGLNPIGKLIYPEYFDCFSKCDLKGNLSSFYSLPDNKYVSLFFPPPPWLDWHCLDALQGNPPVWFTDHLPKYEDALKFDDIE